MRINVYSEEMTDDIELVTKEGVEAVAEPRPIRRTGPTMVVLRELWNAPGEEHYGYHLATLLKSHQSAYAIFRKLEAYGLVSARWDGVEGRRRRYYRLTGAGIDLCREMFRPPDTTPGGLSAPTANRFYQAYAHAYGAES